MILSILGILKSSMFGLYGPSNPVCIICIVSLLILTTSFSQISVEVLISAVFFKRSLIGRQLRQKNVDNRKVSTEIEHAKLVTLRNNYLLRFR